MNAPVIPPYKHTSLFPLGKDTTTYRKISADGVRVEKVMGQEVLVVAPEALRALAEAAFGDINHLLRPAHLKQVRSILDDPEASENDKVVALEFLRNANIAAGGVLPMCQDTGTAIIMGKKGRLVWTDGSDEAALSEGARNAYLKKNLRYSQLAPISMFEEKNTKTNMPAQVEIYAEGQENESAYKFLFVAKGGGSANKSFLFQGTPSILTHDRMLAFLKEKILTLGTAACPPYHLAIVIGGTSAELCMKTVKLASVKYLDNLPTHGSEDAHAFRDLEMEAEIHKLTQQLGIGAQFGGKYFCHDVRVVRLPRHGASLPIGIGVSCSADRQAVGKITRDGVFLEELEHDPAKYLPEINPHQHGGGKVVRVDLNKPMKEILAELTRHPIKTFCLLSGPMIVARDLAHAKLRERLESGQGLPDYVKNHPIYYAGPAKTPEGYASGAFGPTTAGRMDSYVGDFQAAGGSLVTVAKGNRSASVREACQKHGGFYLASIGGAAANLAEHCIKKVEVLEYPELGMEAIWRIEVVDFPAFIVVDDKGNDFFKELHLS
jgi:fumarate hydratase, class I